MAHWVGAQGQVNSAKKAKTSTHYDVTLRRPQTQNKKKINFLIWTTRLAESVEGSNSSLAQSVGEVWCCTALQKKWRKRYLGLTVLRVNLFFALTDFNAEHEAGQAASNVFSGLQYDLAGNATPQLTMLNQLYYLVGLWQSSSKCVSKTNNSLMDKPWAR